MARGCQKRAVCPRTVPPASGRTGEAGTGSVNVDGFSERDDSHSEWLPLAVTLFPKWHMPKATAPRLSTAPTPSRCEGMRAKIAVSDQPCRPGPTVAHLSRGGCDILKRVPY